MRPPTGNNIHLLVRTDYCSIYEYNVHIQDTLIKKTATALSYTLVSYYRIAKKKTGWSYTSTSTNRKMGNPAVAELKLVYNGEPIFRPKPHPVGTIVPVSYCSRHPFLCTVQIYELLWEKNSAISLVVTITLLTTHQNGPIKEGCDTGLSSTLLCFPPEQTKRSRRYTNAVRLEYVRDAPLLCYIAILHVVQRGLSLKTRPAWCGIVTLWEWVSHRSDQVTLCPDSDVKAPFLVILLLMQSRLESARFWTGSRYLL